MFLCFFPILYVVYFLSFLYLIFICHKLNNSPVMYYSLVRFNNGAFLDTSYISSSQSLKDDIWGLGRLRPRKSQKPDVPENVSKIDIETSNIITKIFDILRVQSSLLWIFYAHYLICFVEIWIMRFFILVLPLENDQLFMSRNETRPLSLFFTLFEVGK